MQGKPGLLGRPYLKKLKQKRKGRKELAKDINRHYTKEYTQMASKPKKSVPYPMSSGKCTSIRIAKIQNTTPPVPVKM